MSSANDRKEQVTMMINKRLIGTVSESKKFMAGNVAMQWVSLTANISMIGVICRLLQLVYTGKSQTKDYILTLAVAVLAITMRHVCTTGASRMSYLWR